MEGQFNLDKRLRDNRRSPKHFILPDDEDILITDEHTEETANGDMMHYTKVVGVAKNVSINGKKLDFEWIPTDPSLINLVDSSKFPKKLFKYSPEHVGVNPSEEYEQGEVGILRSIAITNLANDDDAITTRIKNKVNDIIKGDEMKDEEIKSLVDAQVKAQVEPFEERLKLMDKIDEVISKVDKIDVGKLEEVIGMIPDLQKIPELEKNISKYVEDDSEQWLELYKNVKVNSDISEETLQKMDIKDLEVLDAKYEKNVQGASGTGKQKLSVVESFNAKYGTKIGHKE
jgi:hypothetical protein